MLFAALFLIANIHPIIGHWFNNIASLSFLQSVSSVTSTELLDKQGLIWRLSALEEINSLGLPERSARISVETIPSNGIFLRNLGRVLSLRKDYAQSVRVLVLSDEIIPNSPITAWWLGNAFWHNGQREEARNVWHRSGLMDRIVWRYVQPAQGAFESGDWQQSVRLIMQVLEIDPDDAYAHYLLGQNYEQMQRFQEAIPTYRQAGELAMSGTWFKGASYARIGLILRNNLGDPKSALNAFEQAVQIDPSDGWSWIAIGHIHFDFGELDKAKIAYQKAVDLMPDNAVAHWGLGRVAQKLGFDLVAIREFEMAIAKEPAFVEGQVSLGDVYLTYGDKSNALAHYTHALELNPSDEYVKKQIMVLGSR